MVNLATNPANLAMVPAKMTVLVAPTVLSSMTRIFVRPVPMIVQPAVVVELDNVLVVSQERSWSTENVIAIPHVRPVAESPTTIV